MRYRGKVKTINEAILKEPKVNDMFYNTTDNQYYVWSGTEWSIMAKDINLKMTNYELNQQLVSQLKELTTEELESKKIEINNFINSIPDKFLMLLCNELNYYTVFESNSNSKDNPYSNLAEAIIDIILPLGQIKDIGKNNNGVIEIWITNNDESHCYHLFGYDAGIVPVIGR